MTTICITTDAARALLEAARDRLALSDRDALLAAINETAQALQRRELGESIAKPAPGVTRLQPTKWESYARKRAPGRSR